MTGPVTPDWVRDAIFYQIFPDRFAPSARVPKPGPMEAWDTPPTSKGFKGGDLLGVVEHLDHIQALGANAIYFNPIFQSASNHRYHTYDYFAVDPLLGGNAAFKELLDACHARGIRVLLDGVFNHASRGFWPFNHVMEAGAASPYRSWFFLDDEALDAGAPLRAFPLEHATVDLTSFSHDTELGQRSRTTLGYTAWWDLPALPKLNTSDPACRAYLMEAAEYWIRFGADGWRLDVAEEVPDEFWREFRTRVKAINQEAYIVAEIWVEKAQDLRGDMYDALMNYPLGSAILSFVAARTLDRDVLSAHEFINRSVAGGVDAHGFAQRLERAMTVYDDAITRVQLNLLGSHDTPRFLSMAGGDVSAARLAALIQMTVPGAPSIYYGDEIGMEGRIDPDSRGSFPWDHPERWDHGLLAYTSGAAALRHAEPVFRHGTLSVIHAEGDVIAYRLTQAEVTAIVVVNTGTAPAQLDLTVPDLDRRTLLTRRWEGATADRVPDAISVVEGRASLEVAGRDGVVLRTA